MSPGLQIGLGAGAWLLGFVLLHQWGSVLPLFGFALALTAVIVARDSTTRRLLRPRAGPLAVGALAAAVLIAATYLCFPVCARLWPPLTGEVRGLYRLLFHGLGRGAVAVVVVTMSACEEVIFRGRLLTRWGDRPGGAAVRIALAAAFYALVHLTAGSATLIALAFACGLAWGLLRSLTDSLWASLVCHVAWDLAIMIIAPLA